MLIHCTMEELLAIRAGEGSQGALRHLDDCDECRDELERLHQRVAALKALPAVRAPRDRWQMVREQVIQTRSKKRRAVVGWVTVAAAASITLAAGLSQLLPVTAGDQPQPLVTLMEEDQTLQEMLRTLEPETRVMNGRVASAVAVIEDRLTAVDARLTEIRSMRRPSENDLIVLWRQRVDLMDALVRVHATRSTYVGF